MDTGAISHNRRLERHSKHAAARHPNNQYDFTQARPAHLQARDAALDQIIRDVEDSQEDQGLDFDLQRRLGSGLFGMGDDGDSEPGSGSNSGSGSHGGSASNNGGGHSSQPPTSTFSKCINRGPDGVCVDGDQPRTSSTPRTTPSSTRTTSTTPTSTRSTSSSRSTSSTPSSTSSRTTSSSSSSTSIIPSSSSSTLLITTNGTTRTSVSFVTAPSAPESSSTTSSQDDGPGAGPIVGIVAGSLAGVAILSALIGFIWKKYSSKKENEDEYENNPFGGGNDRDDFRRGSTMLQDDGFDEDGEFGGAPSMSEHGIRDGHGSYGAESVLAGAAGMGIAAGGAGMMARNESGAPRPPTMFARHLAQVNNNSAPPMPNAGEMYQGGNEGMYEDAYPQLPPMAFGSGGPPDPYSMNQNISNPYAHLDRAQQQGQEGYYSNLDRSGSQGSNSQGSHHQQHQQYPQPAQFIHQDSFTSAKEDERDFDTSGRPGTAEGRSGTPDLPNMQQTYVMNGGIDGSSIGHNHNAIGTGEVSNNNTTNGHLSREESQRSSTNGNNEDPFNENSPINSGKANVSHQLSVRNLMPNPHEAQQAGGNRPLSTVSSVADPDDIYGGIY